MKRGVLMVMARLYVMELLGYEPPAELRARMLWCGDMGEA